MDKVTIVKIGYFFAPQDRRKIGDTPIDKYVLAHFRTIFRQNLFGEQEDDGRMIVFNIMNSSVDEIKRIAEQLKPELDLCDESVVSVADITDRDDDESEWSGEEEFDKQTDENIKDVLDEIDRLVGMEDYKKLCRNLAEAAMSEDGELFKKLFKNCAFLFCISGGDGFSRYVDLLRKLISACEIKPVQEYGLITEVKKAETLEEMLDYMESDTYTEEMITFDLTFKLEKIDTEEFKNFLFNMRRNSEKKIPVFKIPYFVGESKERMIRALSSVYTLFVVDVEPFTTAQYSEYAISELEEKGYSIEKSARDEIEALIVQKRNEKHFYGFNSVRDIADEILYQKITKEVRGNKKMSVTITEKDLQPMVEKIKAEQGGLSALDEMIGIDEIREKIDEIIVQLELASKQPANERPCMHMLFTGNPGTGKTTVARLLGQILREKNVLSKGLFFERSGREFVGKYIGETAPLTNTICRDAYGSVLFIDEAYTLYHADDERDFGKEAIDTLITQMENHRQDFIVIFSGYSDRMKNMLDANMGLKSRIPHEIKFRNFTKDEMYQIFMNMAGKVYKVDDDLSDAAKKYFLALSKELMDEESFANARFARNLYERTVSKAALRTQASMGGRISDSSEIVLKAEDFKKACEASEFKDLMQKKSRFGFE
ncbi:MAG: AAA family ATPase [Lachnospiraceae bacterium]|nr:AAA family ATPase [Lachnospiraceae bacterium]